MSTILTDDEIAKAGKDCFWPLDEDAPKFARAVEAAVLAKQARQAPKFFYYEESGQLFDPEETRPDEAYPLYTRPAPQQADRHALQAQGKHPSPCARFCESKAYEIEIRQLKSQLEQADRQRVPEGWIETTKAMPPSGQVVLACYKNELGNTRRIRAQWVAAKTSEASIDSDCGEYDEATDTYYDPEGWYECIDNWDCYSSVFVSAQITHWMPLPAAPDAAPEAPAQCDTPRYCASVQRCTADDERRASTPAQASAVDERAAFEGTWHLDLSKDKDGSYTDKETALMWMAWQARAALAQKGGAA